VSGPTSSPGPPDEPRLQGLCGKVEKELARYDHPLFRFSTEARGSSVSLAIDLREGLGVEHHYEISLHEREIENRQFPWTFQKLLYDCLHDFVVEMFERNPQLRE
jgi:sigma54-dependent transcription regulator